MARRLKRNLRKESVPYELKCISVAAKSGPIRAALMAHGEIREGPVAAGMRDQYGKHMLVALHC